MPVFALFSKRFLLCVSLLVFTGYARAEIHLQMADPDWHFLVSNVSAGQTEAQLEPGERGFAQDIQPLLAAQNYEGVLQAFAKRPIENDSAALRQLRGQVLLAQKQYAQAAQALKAALELMPDLALAHRSLSMVYMLQKNYSGARSHLQKSIELGVADAQVYGQLAFVNLQMGQGASAIAGYQQALFLEADNAQWQQGLLYALTESNALDQAQALVDEMLQADPDSVELWLLRSQIALQADKPRQALSSLEVALSLGERGPDNLAIAAQLHLQQGSQLRAVELLSQNLAGLNRDNGAAMLDTLDQVIAWLTYQKNWSAAELLLTNIDKVARQQPDQIPAFFKARFDVYRAQLALNRGDVKRVKHWLTQALNADPSHGDALLALGEYYVSRNQPDAALMYFIRAEALPAFKERALLRRAQLEIDRKSYAAALGILRKVVQLNPGRADIIANVRSLENLVRNQG